MEVTYLEEFIEFLSTLEGIKWSVALLLPILLTIAGWIYVQKLGVKNIKREKQVVVKIEAYNFIKNDINALITSLSSLHSLLKVTSRNLEIVEDDNILSSISRKILIDEYQNERLKRMNEEVGINFIKFIFSWEQYELVFKPLVKQRYALQEEYKEISSGLGETYIMYENYFNKIKLNLSEWENSRNELICLLNIFSEKSLDFVCCISDVSKNIQNYIFGDVLNDQLDKRLVKDEKYLTIETLIKKHKQRLNND